MIAEPRDLVDRARAATGLSDLGADGWQIGLERLVEAARTDLDSDPETLTRLEQRLVNQLASRLRIEGWYRGRTEQPAAVLGPVVIHGLPRTGTTALHYLLTNDPQFRFQRRWEISSPVPPPGATGDTDDPRRLALLSQVGSSGGSVRHISDPDGPMDDNMILGLDFHNQELGLPLPSYTRWWRRADLTTTYAYHERVLRLLHTGRPPYRWLVKAPYHNFHLDDLAAHYPQARFIMTHRDPATSVPSACSTVLDAQRKALPRRPPDPLSLGSFLLEHLVEGAERAMAARAAIGEDRFLDVTQGDLEDDPIGVAERAYAFLGLELGPATRARMSDWAAGHRRGYQGEHRYSAEEYGLAPESIRAAFADYLERFDVRTDGR